jgi:hypothetical protein
MLVTAASATHAAWREETPLAPSAACADAASAVAAERTP